MIIPEQYELLQEQEIPEKQMKGTVLRHKKSGARLFLVENEDPNKVFNIIFRTAPMNDTGAPHIMEHSVLCGSERFPVKDPFIELAKGSMNTFLNAMTFPDKTMYPVASCNLQDLKNLMAVYMDAVFHPNIYTNEKIFRQEGWHYELESPDDELMYNGVVYNEMRGAYSDPDEVLLRQVAKMLFPHTPYAYDSGGDPKYITDLSYEDFIAFHQRYYHPSNSYIFLYGDMDMTERLNWLDKEYLQHYDAIDPKSEIPEETPFTKMQEGTVYYAVSPDEEEPTCSYCYAKVVGGLKNGVETLALDTIEDILLSMQGAALKQAILDAGIGTEVFSDYSTEYRQPIFYLVVRGAKAGEAEHLKAVVEETLQKVVEEGISKHAILASLNLTEYTLRKTDFDRMPGGLLMSMDACETWLHDDLGAMTNIAFEEDLKTLRELVKGDYLEKLIKERLIENPYGVLVTEEPKTGLIEEEEERVREKLAAYKASLSDAEIQKIIDDTKALKDYQSEPDSEEALSSVPLMEISDIEREIEPDVNEECEISGIPVILHELPTRGITDVEINVSIADVKEQDLPYMAVLDDLFTMLDTEHYSYRELNEELRIYAGRFVSSMTNYNMADDMDATLECYDIRARFLTRNMPEILKLVSEIFMTTKFDDMKRIREVIREKKGSMSSSLLSGGNATASGRALSYISRNAKRDQYTNGIGYYRFLCDLDDHFEERKDELKAKLEELQAGLLKKDGMVISITAEKEGYEEFEKAFPVFAEKLSDKKLVPAERELKLEVLNEGFRTASQVQYAAIAGNFRNAGFKYRGALQVLRTILNYDYLWQNVRVKGGAYGCSAIFSVNGFAVFTSYRDPNCKATVDLFKAIPEYIRTLQISDRDMKKYIIGSAGDPHALSVFARGAVSFVDYMTHADPRVQQERRNDLIDATQETIHELAELVQAAVDASVVCVVGNENVIERDRELFLSTATLNGDKA